MSFLKEFPRSEKLPRTKNVIITPFLPLRVFEQYAKFERTFSGNGVSAGLAGNVAVICSGIGARNVFNAVEALKGHNCRNIIFIGSCGGLGRARIGDILLADTKDATGVSGLSGSFGSFLHANGVAFGISRIYSVESIKDETEALIDNLEKGGFLGVDLETNVFGRTAAANAYNACAVLYVTDVPLKRPFTEKFSTEERAKIVSARDSVVKAAVGFLEELS